MTSISMKQFLERSDLPRILEERVKRDPNFMADNKLCAYDVINCTDLYLKALGLERVEGFQRKND